jgi:carbonic anhydrase/acetyltransferase-like protein (isoleucine patch superfamily)
MSLLHYKGVLPDVKDKAWIAPNATVIGNVEVGADVSIWFGAVVRGDVHYIKIGDRSNIQDNSVVHVTHYEKDDKSDGQPTIIGSDVTVGHNVILHGCVIEDGCLIGMGAIIIDGVVIGKESIVGAGALVTKGKIFPPRSLIMGNPAKLVRTLTD